MVAVLLFNKHNKFSPYPSDQSVPILIRVINLSYHSYVVVFSLSLSYATKAIWRHINPTLLELEFLLQCPCCNFSPLAIKITLTPESVHVFCFQELFAYSARKVVSPKGAKSKNSLINSSNLHTKMRLWWVSWDYSPLDFPRLIVGKVQEQITESKSLKTLGP